MTPQEVLDIEFYCDDLEDTVTIRNYLKELLHTLVQLEEGFSGKRPFGNSGWMCDLAQALVVGGAVSGEVVVYDFGTEDEHTEATGYDWGDVHQILADAIRAL